MHHHMTDARPALLPPTPRPRQDDFYQIELPAFIQFCRDARITDEDTCTEESITEVSSP